MQLNHRLVFTTAAAVAVACSAEGPKWHELDATYTFDQYKSDFDKEYTDKSEDAKRKTIFERNLQDILQHNMEGRWSYKKGVNQFTDVLQEEMPSNKVVMPEEGERSIDNLHVRSGKPLPTHVDWRDAKPNVVGPVHNQGACGNCWAHSAAESLESQWAIKKGTFYMVSTQMIADCTHNKPNVSTSCRGGVSWWGWEAIMGRKRQSVETEWDYPYISEHHEQEVCKFAAGKSAGPVQVYGYKRVSASVEDIMDAVANVGPLSMGVDASWSGYSGGVYDGPFKCPVKLDHFVVLDGYGTDNVTGLDYWLVRNSWGAGWGDHGYIKILRNATPTCGTGGQNTIVLNDFAYPLVEKQ